MAPLFAMPRLLIAAVLLLIAFGAAAQDYAVVVMYHRVGDGRFPSTNIRVEQFEAHLDYLAENDFRVMALPTIMRRLRAGESLPEKTVAITFDDAYTSVRENAHPRLQKRGWPYTLFVAADPVDQGMRGYLDWDAMRSMRGPDVVFANHSASHAHLVRRRDGDTLAGWRQRIGADIGRGQRRLVEELGKEAVATDPPLFAYPYGEYNTEVGGMLRNRGYAAFGQHSGVIDANADQRALPRFSFNERYAAMAGFRDKIHGRPLTVREVTPWDPVVADGQAPRLVLSLSTRDGSVDRLQCFYGSQRLAVKNLGSGRAAITADGELPPGRSRYNCTLPAADGTFYWYSHLWLNGRHPAWD